jgi:hypothetical protein
MDTWPPVDDDATCPSPTGEGLDEELDDAAAADARERYRTAGPATLAVSGPLAGLLRPGEPVFALHEHVTALLRPLDDRGASPEPIHGTLLLTSARIIVSSGGAVGVDVDLEDIEEAVVSGALLLLVLGRGSGLSLALAQPRLLRVQVAAARSVARGSGTHAAGEASLPAR